MNLNSLNCWTIDFGLGYQTYHECNLPNSSRTTKRYIISNFFKLYVQFNNQFQVHYNYSLPFPLLVHTPIRSAFISPTWATTLDRITHDLSHCLFVVSWSISLRLPNSVLTLHPMRARLNIANFPKTAVRDQLQHCLPLRNCTRTPTRV